MNRPFMLQRTRSGLLAYGRRYAEARRVSLAAPVAAILQSELLYALLLCGAAPWLALTGGAALQRAYGSARHHADIDLIATQPLGGREIERWHDTIQTSIGRAYGLSWVPSTVDDPACLLDAELSWSTADPLCAPIRVRILRGDSQNVQPHRISPFTECIALPIASLVLHSETPAALLARTIACLPTGRQAVAQSVYDLSILHALEAPLSAQTLRQIIADQGSDEIATAKRIRAAVLDIQRHLVGDWSAVLSDELPVHARDALRPLAPQLVQSAVGMLEQVIQRLQR